MNTIDTHIVRQAVKNAQTHSVCRLNMTANGKVKSSHKCLPSRYSVI